MATRLKSDRLRDIAVAINRLSHDAGIEESPLNKLDLAERKNAAKRRSAPAGASKKSGGKDQGPKEAGNANKRRKTTK